MNFSGARTKQHARELHGQPDTTISKHYKLTRQVDIFKSNTDKLGKGCKFAGVPHKVVHQQEDQPCHRLSPNSSKAASAKNYQVMLSCGYEMALILTS